RIPACAINAGSPLGGGTSSSTKARSACLIIRLNKNDRIVSDPAVHLTTNSSYATGRYSRAPCPTLWRIASIGKPVPTFPGDAQNSARFLLRRAADLLLNLALQFQCARRQRRGAGLQEIRIEAAIVVDALERVGRDAQPHVPPQRVRDEGDVAQVRQETPLGLDVGEADLVARPGGLGRQFEAPRHLENPLPSPPHSGSTYGASRGSNPLILYGTAGRIGALARSVKVSRSQKAGKNAVLASLSSI